MPLSSSLVRGRLGLAVAALALGLVSVPAAASASSSAVVVNEVYGGGGNAGATFTNDFVELANRSDAAVDVDRLVGPVPRRPAPARGRSPR